MDNELQTYTDQIMDQQQYRSGIFSSVLSPIVKAMAAFRYSANERGAYSSGRDYWMDKELATFVDQTLDAQVYRDGISFAPGFVHRFVSLFRRSW